MKLHLITTLDEVLQSESNWDRVAGDHPFFRWTWMVNWLEYQKDDVSPAILVWIEDGEWLAIAPFCVDRKTSKLVRKLRFLGSGRACSDYLGLIADGQYLREFSESVADWLTENIRPGGPLGKIDVIELEGACPDDEPIHYFFELLKASGFRSQTIPIEGCWALDLPESWDELNSAVGKKLRRKTKKALKRLADPDTEILTTHETDLDELWPLFVNLHQERREMLGQPGCFADSDFDKFLFSATRGLIEQGKGELVVIKYQGDPLGAFLLLNDGHTVYMYQSGMSTKHLKLEPGYQAAVLTIQRSIEQGFKRFDFLRGDEPYKSRWLTERIPLVKSRFIPARFSARVKHGLWNTGRTIRNYLNATDADRPPV